MLHDNGAHTLGGKVNRGNDPEADGLDPFEKEGEMFSWAIQRQLKLSFKCTYFIDVDIMLRHEQPD